MSAEKGYRGPKELRPPMPDQIPQVKPPVPASENAGGKKMKGIVLKSDLDGDDYEYLGDCAIIQRALANVGYFATLRQARRLWEEYSESYAAGWMGVPDQDEHIVRCIEPFFMEVG